MGKRDKIAVKSSKRGYLKLKKRKLKEEGNIDGSPQDVQICSRNEDTLSRKEKGIKTNQENDKDDLTLKKKRRREKKSEIDSHKIVQLSNADEDSSNKLKKKKRVKTNQENDKDDQVSKKEGRREREREVGSRKVVQLSHVDEDGSSKLKSAVKKAGKGKKKEHLLLKREEKSKENKSVVEEETVDQISSVDEDCSSGMKKWLIEYHQSRPGLKILQQKIDEFITSHEAQQEQARKEREALATEGGWTVVVHHKGRKKTTDSESGIAVGSVAQAAVEDKVAKKKRKDIALDFYRFQKREAKRNEVMMLQRKFEQDKKRIQQLRATRKFRPY